MSECAICGKPELTAVHDHSLEQRQAGRIRALEVQVSLLKSAMKELGVVWDGLGWVNERAERAEAERDALKARLASHHSALGVVQGGPCGYCNSGGREREARR